MLHVIKVVVASVKIIFFFGAWALVVAGLAALWVPLTVASYICFCLFWFVSFGFSWGWPQGVTLRVPFGGFWGGCPRCLDCFCLLVAWGRRGLRMAKGSP